jgi:DNA-binding transcriptional MerR regulator
MGTIRYQIVRYRHGPLPPPGSLLTVEELSRLAQVHPDMIQCFVDWDLVEPERTDPEMLFPGRVVPRIRRILRLRKDLGVNWAGIGVVLDLLDRIDTLEGELGRLRTRLAGL